MKTIFKSILAVLATVFIASSCSDVPAPYNVPGEGDNGGGSETATVIFEESFATGQGDFTIKDVKKPTEKPSEVWTFDSYKYMKATAFYNDNGTFINNEAESWLISPEIDLTAYSGDLKLSFDQVNRYFANNQTDATVQVTTDGGATWIQLSVSKYSSGDSWTDWATAECSLTPYAGKKIQFAFKYVSTSTKAGTWEIKNVKVETGKAGDAEGGGDTPSTGQGEGTKANPYDITTAQSKQDGSNAWVKAYIVGSVKDKSWSTDVEFGTTSASQTNIIIAASASETDKANCMPVQLPTGEIRTALNLKDKPAMLGKEVLLYGQLTKYFGVPGLKNITAAIVDGQLIGTDPDAGGETPTESNYVLGASVAPSDIAAGTYAIGYTYEGTNYLLKHEVYSSYYVAAEAYTAGSNVDAKCVLTVEKADNGFKIKGYDGKYIGISINDTHVNLIPTETDGSTVWTFTTPSSSEHDMENDCKMTSNKSNEKFLIFSWYSKTNTAEFTAGTYSSQYVNRYPVFYKLTKK